MTYRPALDAAELDAAALSLRLAAAAATERARHAPFARTSLVSTGFSGEAATLAYAKIDVFGGVFARGAADLQAAAVLVDTTARLQRQLDEAADFAANHLHQRAVLWLNSMSMPVSYTHLTLPTKRIV